MTLTETESRELAAWGATPSIIEKIRAGNYSEGIDEVGKLQDSDKVNRSQLVHIIEQIREARKIKED